MHSKEVTQSKFIHWYWGREGGGGEGGMGATPGNSWEVLPGSPNPDPISDQKKAIFHTRFQTWSLNAYHFQTWLRQKLCHHYLD